MTPQPFRLRSLAVAAAGLLAVSAFAACSSGRSFSVQPTTTAFAPTGQQIATPPAPRLDDELGLAPVFWRTLDQFDSLRADEPYKVVLRVTNGYDEETIRIMAKHELNRNGALEFEASLAEPAGQEGPGAFYPFNIDLPESGVWILTVFTGEGSASIIVDVKPASG